MPSTVLNNTFFSGNEGLGKFEPLTTLNHRRHRKEIKKIDNIEFEGTRKYSKLLNQNLYTSPVNIHF